MHARLHLSGAYTPAKTRTRFMHIQYKRHPYRNMRAHTDKPHTHTHTHPHTHIHEHTHAHTHTHINTPITHTHTQAHTLIHAVSPYLQKNGILVDDYRTCMHITLHICYRNRTHDVNIL